MDNVSKTRSSGLCVSCEACTVICPTNAIDMELNGGQFVPTVNESKCIDCGKCLEVCYGINIETEKVEAGEYIEVYDAYVPDDKIRIISTSGGVISRLLYALLKDEIVDGAFVLDFDKFTREPARLKLIKNPTEVYNASGSKYIPASVRDVLTSIKENKSYVMVGTPCMIYAVRQFLKEKNLNVNMIYFGLFCDRTLNFNFIRYMEDKYSIKKEKLQKIKYKNKEKRGWPGDVKLIFNTQREVYIDGKKRREVKDLFMLERCLCCVDKLNKSADISFGDCFIHGKTSPERTSVVVRTETGKKIFDKYLSIFKVNKSSMEGVKNAQSIEKRIERLNYAKLINCNQVNKKIIEKKKKINVGRNYSLLKIRFHLTISKIKRYFGYLKDYARIIKSIIIGANVIPISTEESQNTKHTRRNILIRGGNLNNKGAQAMTFTVVHNISRYKPYHDVYLLSTKDFKRDAMEKEMYNFKIIPWDRRIRMGVLENENHPYRQIIENTDLIFDISGFGISSQHGPPYYWIYNYFHFIYMAKKFDIPLYFLPQSIGPFDYRSIGLPLFWALQKKYFSYPERIYCREEAGINSIKIFAQDNIRRRHDIVLTDDYDISSVYTGDIKNIKVKGPAVGIVPNTRISDRVEYEDMINFYKISIKQLKKRGFNIYLIRHSNEDVSIINDLKSLFINDSDVIPITEELYAFELERLIAQLEFMIASRYHSIVHAYRHGVPCMVLGWAVKYQELLKDFEQEDYVFDVRKGLDIQSMNICLKQLIHRYKKDSDKIKNKLNKIRKNEGRLFEEIFTE